MSVCCSREKSIPVGDLNPKEERVSCARSLIGHCRKFVQVMPFLWPKGEHVVKLCVVLSLVFMILSKFCTVAVPLAYRNAVNILTNDDTINQAQSFDQDDNTNATIVYYNEQQSSTETDVQSIINQLIYPVYWILIYGCLKFFGSFFEALRETVFVNITQHALRCTAIRTFAHLHHLSVRFHLNKKTGGILRAIDRGTRAIALILAFFIFEIAPIVIEIFLVCTILIYLYPIYFALITFSTMALYISLTVISSEWRIKFRREMNEGNNNANNKAVDSLVNFETVKYFNNEEHEVTRYEQSIVEYNKASIKAQVSSMLINTTQTTITVLGVTSVMLLAAHYVYVGSMSVGDFVLVNTYMLQLVVPLNFLGRTYRILKNSMVDMENMFKLLEEPIEIVDLPDAKPLLVPNGTVSFKDVAFCYEVEKPQAIYTNLTFDIPAGKTLAVVGPSGAGKSTLSKLLFRFYDIQSGSIQIDGQDIRSATLQSLRSHIGIVPQDTVLFNDTIEYNIRYGNLMANESEVEEAARMAHIHEFIVGLPDGYNTIVGERGIRLSGGEKQRIGIARAILKKPSIIVFDEATSALDTKTERLIQAQLKEVAKGRTTIIVAHRLSTIVDADEIIVLKNGSICEKGTHSDLYALQKEYYSMWQEQESSSL